MVIPFSLMTPKEDAAQNVPNTQVNFLLLCYKVFLGSSILNVSGMHLPERPTNLAQPLELKQLNNAGSPLQRRSKANTASIQHLTPTHIFPTCGRWLHAGLTSIVTFGTPYTWLCNNWCHGHLQLWRMNSIRCFLVNIIFFKFQVILLWW